MSSCCPDKPEASPREVRCPRSGSVAVDRQTVKSLLTEQALARLTPGAYRFCPDANCDVVYFSMDDAQFGTEEVRVGVWQEAAARKPPGLLLLGESDLAANV